MSGDPSKVFFWRKSYRIFCTYYCTRSTPDNTIIFILDKWFIIFFAKYIVIALHTDHTAITDVIVNCREPVDRFPVDTEPFLFLHCSPHPRLSHSSLLVCAVSFKAHLNSIHIGPDLWARDFARNPASILQTLRIPQGTRQFEEHFAS